MTSASVGAAASAGAASREPILRVRDISFAYPNGLQALAGVDFDVPVGRGVGIVGPSGCGKSTLLGVIAGLTRPTSGTVEWLRSDEPDPRTRRLFTLVFQKDTLLPWLTVERNIAFGLRYLAIEKGEQRDRISLLLRLAGLEDVRTAYPYQLSGGMRRRVAFLVGVAPLPRVLLLDEPFAALDEPTRITIHREVLKIVRELEISTVLVTHDLAEAISLCDHVYVLTQRPARIASAHAIPFGQDRDPLDLRETSEYHDLYRRVWHDLSVQLKAGEMRKAQGAANGDPTKMQQ